MNGPAVTIAGGGLSGLAAALAVARRGAAARVFERRREVGARFHGDFQGLENWSTEGDVLEELESLGIAPTFSCAPFRECVFFDPDGREHVCRSSKPLWYLVRRGTDAGTLDQALEAQALAAGVELRCGEGVEHLPHGGIVAHGPRRVDAIVVGYVFQTDRSDAAFGAVSDELAPGGYAYLLICRGQATLAACLFADFHNDKEYLARTVDFFARTAGVSLRDARAFGGFGNMSPEPTLRRGHMLIAGEAAGLQDALFGFGMRYALVSGHLAGDAFAGGDLARYEYACRQRFGRAIRASAVNRYLYLRAGRRGYRTLVERLSGASDPRAWLRAYYNGHWWMPFVFPLARAEANRRRASPAHECRDACDCTYCRCLREAAGHITPGDAAGAVDRNESGLADAGPRTERRVDYSSGTYEEDRVMTRFTTAVVVAGLVAVAQPGSAQTPPAASAATQGQEDHQAHHPAPADQPVTPAQEAEIAGMQQKMMADMKAMDARLDALITRMNAANGDAKIAAMAEVLTTIVQQRTAMRDRMMSMQSQMMGHMMQHMSAGMSPDMKKMMAECPMMKQMGAATEK